MGKAIEIPTPENATQEIMEAVENAVAAAISETRNDESQQRAWLKHLSFTVRDMLNSPDIPIDSETSLTHRLRLERDIAITSLYQRMTRISRSDLKD